MLLLWVWWIMVSMLLLSRIFWKVWMCVFFECLQWVFGNGLNGIRLILFEFLVCIVLLNWCIRWVSLWVCLGLLLMFFIRVYLKVIDLWCLLVCRQCVYEVISLVIGYFLLSGISVLCSVLFGVCSDIVSDMLFLVDRWLICGIRLEVDRVMCLLVRLQFRLLCIMFMVCMMLLKFISGLFMFIIIMLVRWCIWCGMLFRWCVVIYIWLMILVVVRLWLKFWVVVEQNVQFRL